MKIRKGRCRLRLRKPLICKRVDNRKQGETIKKKVAMGCLRGHRRSFARVWVAASAMSVGGGPNTGHHPAGWDWPLARSPALGHSRTASGGWLPSGCGCAHLDAASNRRRFQSTMRSASSGRPSCSSVRPRQGPMSPLSYVFLSRMWSGFGQSCSANSFSRVEASFNWPRRARTRLSRSIVNSVSTVWLPSFRR
jgi:hypothetical protein